MASHFSSIRFIAFFIVLIFFTNTKLVPQIRFTSSVVGRVIDIETSKPLSDVNVFLANTTLGDATDKDGHFLIENIPPGAYDLIVSRLGYKLEIVPIQFMTTTSIEYNIKLHPHALKGEMIQIEAAVSHDWQKNLEKFTKEFLGQTENASKCKILNPEVLNFQIDPQSDQFIATTDSMLIIENGALGYRLHIILEAFRFTQDSIIYAIYPRYEELIPQHENEPKQWLDSRRETYKGSFRHFLSALARNDLEQEHFKLFRLDGHPFDLDQIRIIPDTSQAVKWLYLDRPLKVAHGFSPYSYIYMRKGYVQIDTLGNVYTRFALMRSGYWTRERVANMLPYDYVPDYEYNKK